MFTQPPVMLARYRLNGSIRAATNQAERVKRTIHCLKRLRPDWEGNMLYDDAIDHIGKKAAEGHVNYDIDDAITIHFQILIRCHHPCAVDTSAFEKMQGTMEEGICYDVYRISFLWWRDRDTELADLKQMGNAVENMFPEEFLQDYAHGSTIDAEYEYAALNDDDIIDSMVEFMDDYSEREYTFVRWFTHDEDNDWCSSCEN